MSKQKSKALRNTLKIALATTMLTSSAWVAIAADDTIKVGVMLIDTGPLAGIKDSQQKAATLAIENLNAAGGAAGKKFEGIYVSYAGTPDAAVDAATRVIQKDGAIFITGMSTSSVAPALAAKMPALKAIQIDVMAKADGLTGKGCSPNFFRVVENDSMTMGLYKDLLKDQPFKKWDMLSVDYAVGRDTAEKFKGLVTAQGGTVGKSLFAPLGTPDFGAKISELGADPAEGLLVTIFGSDAINLAKQQQQFGLFKKYKMVLGNSFVIPQTLPAQGEAVLGVYQPQGFTADFPGAQAQKFVSDYRAKYNGETPPYTAADQYVGLQLMAAAVNKAKSTNVDEVLKALSGIKTETLLGEVEMRAGDHQLVRPVAVTVIGPGPDGKPTYKIKKIEAGATIIPPVDPACKM